MSGDIPLELVIPAPVGIVRVPRPLTAKNLGVVFSELTEAIAGQAESLLTKIGSNAEPADTSHS
jgi:hypothetical protein